MHSRFTIALLLLVIPVLTRAQLNPGDSTDTDLSNFIELLENSVAEDASSEDFNTALSHLEYFLEHPIPLNTVSMDELHEFELLTDQQISDLLDYRDRMGEFVEPGELLTLRAFQSNFDPRLIAYFTVKNTSRGIPTNFNDYVSGGSHDFMLRVQRILEEKRGFDEQSNGYEGSRNKLYLRYRYRVGRHLSLGLTGEKDEGESFFQESNKASWSSPWAGFDFASAHLAMRFGRTVRQVLVGDYNLRFGQGLVLWNGLAFRKGAYPLQAQKQGSALSPYTSVNEASFFRGVATHLALKKWHVYLFSSLKNRDANVTETDTLENEPIEVSSIQSSGFHRTQNEISDEGSISELLLGGRVSFESRHFQLGTTLATTHWSATLNRADQPYNALAFSGDQQQHVAVDFQLARSKMLWFGEQVITNEAEWAFANGVTWAMHPRMDVIAIGRHYSAGYSSPYANAFGESSSVGNEQGFYLGTQFRPHAKWDFSAYYDLYRFPWLRFTADAPSQGRDWFIQANYQVNKTIQLYFRYKEEWKENNLTNLDLPIDIIGNDRIRRFRAHFINDITYYLNAKSRVEFSWFDPGDGDRELGFVVFQDIQYSLYRLPVKITGRVAFFDTESFQSAIYAYENDVLYAFSIPAYSGRGIRYYLMAKIEPLKNLDLWVRYSRSSFDGVETIGTGLEQIEGNNRSEIKFQLRWRWS